MLKVTLQNQSRKQSVTENMVLTSTITHWRKKKSNHKLHNKKRQLLQGIVIAARPKTRQQECIEKSDGLLQERIQHQRRQAAPTVSQKSGTCLKWQQNGRQHLDRNATSK